METSRPQPIEQSWFLESVSELTQFAGRLGRNFVKVLVAGQAFVLVLAAVVYFSTRGGPGWRAPAGFALTLIVPGAIAFAIAVNLAAVLSLAQTVRSKGLAKRTLDRLFAELLGITAENPQGDFDLTRSLHGLPVAALRGKLRHAGQALLDNRVALALPGFVRWLAGKAQAVLVWATVWAVVAYATAKTDREKKVDLLELRGNLTQVVDDLVTTRITQGAIRLGLLMALAVSVAAFVLVKALVRFAP